MVAVGGWLLRQQRTLAALRLRMPWRRGVAETIYITLDTPDTRKSPALSGTILIQGWSVAQTGIKRVEAAIRGGPVTEAKINQPRPDVGAIYSQFPGSERAGFRAQLDLGTVPDGQQTLYIRAQSRRGRSYRKNLKGVPGGRDLLPKRLGENPNLRYHSG